MNGFRSINVMGTEKRLFPPAEAVIAYRNRNGYVDANHAYLDSAGKISSSISVTGENCHAISMRVTVNQVYRIFIVVSPHS